MLTLEWYAEMMAWLAEQGLRRRPAQAVFNGFCDRVRDLGLPLDRARTTMYTLHPTIESVAFHWGDGRERDRFDFLAAPVQPKAWNASPMKAMLDQGLPRLRRRLTGPAAVLDYPAFEDFAREGFTDYFARLYGFSLRGRRDRKTGNISRWFTRAGAGFNDAHIAAIEALVPPLALALQTSIDREIGENVLDAYLGRIAGRRVLTGEIRLGTTETIHAALMFADLSDFTAASDTLDLDGLVATLNRLYAAMVEPVHDRGGHILKYLGDGFLAIFPIEGGSDGESCRAALAAARRAVADTRVVNAERAANGEPALPLHVALNLGDVAFGNVGAGGRLDFTVIGPAVNEASRIEKLCRPLGRSILMTDSFAEALASDEAEDLGAHALRGVRGSLRLFGVRSGGEG